MANKGSSNHRPAKRCKLVGSVSYGTAPTEFTADNDKEKVIFRIHNFAKLKEKQGEHLYTKSIKACGHQWRLKIYPQGSNQSRRNTEYVTICVYCNESNETNPITARAVIRTKTETIELSENKYYHKGRGRLNFKKRKEIIRDDLDNHGTFTIEVDIEVATTVPVRAAVWYPKMLKHNEDDIGLLLYRTIDETSDVSFLLGKMPKQIKAHKIILAVRAKDLFGLITTEEESSSSNDPIQLSLPDVDADAFEILLEFIYINKEPLLFEHENEDDDDANKAMLLEKGKKILLVADRCGCTGLKLYIESFLVDKVLIPSNAAGLLLFADSFSCPLLKEACMNIFKSDSKSFMMKDCGNNDVNDANGNNNGDHENSAATAAVYWKQLQESTKLLTELLVYTNASSSGRKIYSSVTGDGDGTLADADEYDVTSLRERLEKYGLDMDGSQEILLQRWKDHLTPHGSARRLRSIYSTFLASNSDMQERSGIEEF